MVMLWTSMENNMEYNEKQRGYSQTSCYGNFKYTMWLVEKPIIY